ncbi:MAG: penicillin-binding protein 2 [Gammaproteobacteria bacterium]|jgi:penicillin-binding protein 2|nr:penicillin-binding protein 2 [Gammaproteobacteria bacterium]
MPTRLTIKDHIRESRLFNERAVWAMVISALLLLGIIGGRLVYLQVLNYGHYATLSDGNRINLVPVPPMRGFIHDRNGVVLAQNVPSFSLEIIPEKTEDLEETIARLRAIITIGDEDVRRFYRQLRSKRPFSSVPLRFNLSDTEMARFAVERHRFPGVETEARALRFYPHGRLGVHAIGYVGRINEEELRQLDSNYSATDFIGKTGAERYYERLLHGDIGLKQIETNALGRVLRELSRTEAHPGQSIYLTIDAELQRVAEEAIGDRRGAVVAIDPANGDILVLASMPSYDPNLFVTGIDQRTYDELQNSIDKPLFNRALRGQYPPGSTIKPFIGLAGLESDRISASTSSFCPGWFSLEGDDHRFRDWKEHGHGTMNVESAIVQSCDVFFYDLAVALGIDRIHDYLSRFGFGRVTGIDLRDERPGLLPSREWKRMQRNEPWYRGETVITGIGQGYMLATPLQLAHAAATLGSRGRMHPPRLVRAVEHPTPAGVQELPSVPRQAVEIVDERNWDAIIEAMRKVMHSPTGTAAAVGRNAPFQIAGKTGTAQVFGIAQDARYVEADIAERLRDHALFIALAPARDPRIAIAVIIENGGSGSGAAAPVARQVIDHYLERPAS